MRLIYIVAGLEVARARLWYREGLIRKGLPMRKAVVMIADHLQFYGFCFVTVPWYGLSYLIGQAFVFHVFHVFFLGAHQSTQDNRSWPFGHAHARCFEAAAQHTHISNYKVGCGKVWAVIGVMCWAQNMWGRCLQHSRYEKVGQKSVRFVGVDTEESGKDGLAHQCQAHP